jgi:hypothetical protein
MTDARVLDVAKRIQKILDGKKVGPARPRVLTDDIERPGGEDGLWYIPVSIHRDTEHMYLVYQAFSETEEEMESQGVEILLVPRIIPFEKLQDSA